MCRMTGRMGRAAAVYAALGVLWWALTRVGWAAVGCDDWDCLVPAVGTYVLITAAVLGGAAPVLHRVDVRPGRRVALVAAGTLLAVRAAGEAVPSWTGQLGHAVAAGAAFAGAGAVAAFVTDRELPRRWKVLAVLAVAGLAPVTFAVLWIRS